MSKWTEALWLDLIGREDEQRLTEAEQTPYTLVLAGVCAFVATGTLVAGWWLPAGILGAVAARKAQIYVRRRRRGL